MYSRRQVLAARNVVLVLRGPQELQLALSVVNGGHQQIEGTVRRIGLREVGGGQPNLADQVANERCRSAREVGLLGEPLLECGSLESPAPCMREELDLYRPVDGVFVLGEKVIGERGRWLLDTGRSTWTALALAVGATQIGIGRASTPNALRGDVAVLVHGRGGEQTFFDRLLALGRLLELVALLQMLVLASGVLRASPAAVFAASSHALVDLGVSRSP